MISCCLASWPRGARAHPAPAEAPDFGKPACVSSVDKSKQTSFDLAYTLAMDDTTFGQFDIPMPDAKTHQFFAFAGALFSDSVGYRLFSFDPALSDGFDVPLWINGDDVMRAAHASGDVAGAMFSVADIPSDSMLAQNAALAGRFIRITADDARLPITLKQAMNAVHWDLSQVAPGVYTIAAYIFSPPYNGWAVRPGLVKVIDAAHDAPAAVIDPINDFVFSYQGHKVSACIDAPRGTRLEVAMRIEEHAELGYMPVMAAREVSSGPLALCLHNPKPELSGSLRMRLSLTAPDGTTTVAYSPDHITALNGEGTCVQSDSVCCDFETSAASHAGAAGMHGGPAGSGAGSGKAGCSVTRVRDARASALAVAAVFLLAACAARSRRRRARAIALGVLLVLLGACSDATAAPRAQAHAPAKTSGVARPEPLQASDAHAISLPPEMAALGAARYYREQGQPEQALGLLDRLAQRYPTAALPAERAAERAATLCALGRMAEAKFALDDLSRLSPRPELLTRAQAACAPP